MARKRSLGRGVKISRIASQSDEAPQRIAVRFRLRVSTDDVIAIGPGKIALLEAIQRCGSISAAARSLDMSYRRAWMLLNELNASLLQPAADSVHGGANGGGSKVTDAGRELIEVYRRIEKTAEQTCASDISRILGMLAR